MSDAYELLINAVVAIKSDKKLKEAFIEILKVGSSSQQVRVKRLLEELEYVQAPEDLKKFVLLLSNDKIAHRVLTALSE